MMNSTDVKHFVPSGAENFRFNNGTSHEYLTAHLTNMHIFALRTLQNPANFNKLHVAMGARRRLTQTVAEMINLYDYHKPISDQLALKGVIHKAAESTNNELGLMGIGQWFARVMGNVNPELAPIMGRIAISAIVAKDSNIARNEPAAVGSFVRGIATELPKLTAHEVGYAYRATLNYLLLMEMRNRSQPMGESCNNYRRWLVERVGEMDLQMDHTTMGRIEREVQTKMLG